MTTSTQPPVPPEPESDKVLCTCHPFCQNGRIVGSPTDPSCPIHGAKSPSPSVPTAGGEAPDRLAIRADKMHHLVYKFESQELRDLADWLDYQRSAGALIQRLETPEPEPTAGGEAKEGIYVMALGKAFLEMHGFVALVRFEGASFGLGCHPELAARLVACFNALSGLDPATIPALIAERDQAAVALWKIAHDGSVTIDRARIIASDAATTLSSSSLPPQPQQENK